ncbi:MAG: copper amine oxidase N-terminal domain-containing protein [Firmicutes bacterium]|nr:copper amine oxidase N-terminal domain-containing protein [Bacillota bacterium]
MIPVGGLFTALGYTVNWDADLLQATMTRFHVTVTITEGSRNFTVNNINRNFRVPATLINGNLMVPFLEVVEAIGGRANLDANGNINIFVTR